MNEGTKLEWFFWTCILRLSIINIPYNCSLSNDYAIMSLLTISLYIKISYTYLGVCTSKMWFLYRLIINKDMTEKH